MSEIISLIKNSEWKTYPFHYTYIENVFHEDLYRRMLENLPLDSEYRTYSKRYRNRRIYKNPSPFWVGVFEMFKEEKTRIQLSRDLPGYYIGPHTDGPKEFITALFYLTDREIPDAGTSIYLPKRHGFLSNGAIHLPFDQFDKYWTAPFRPNSCFAFKRSDNSFHGVEPTDAVRNILHLSIYKP